MRSPRRVAWLGALLLAAYACAGSESPAGSGQPAPDASAIDAGPLTLLLGRCVQQKSGADCIGEDGEQVRYVALSAGDALMRAVTGPQGSVMLVFVASATGIALGDPAHPASTDNPRLELTVRDLTTDGVVGRYRGRVAFELDPQTQLPTVSSGIFVVLSEPVAAIAGHALLADAELVDATGITLHAQAQLSVEAD